MLYSFNCFDCRRAITLFNNYQEIIQTDISRASEKRVLSVKICCNGENPRVLILVQALFAAHRYVQQTSIFREEESYFFCGLISREIEQTFEIVYSSQVVAKTQKLALHAFFVRLSALEEEEKIQAFLALILEDLEKREASGFFCLSRPYDHFGGDLLDFRYPCELTLKEAERLVEAIRGENYIASFILMNQDAPHPLRESYFPLCRKAHDEYPAIQKGILKVQIWQVRPYRVSQELVV